MSNVIEGAHGLALHPNENSKYATVMEPAGDIWVTDGGNGLWRTKEVHYKGKGDNGEEIDVSRTTRFPAFADSAAHKLWKKVAPEGAAIGSVSSDGEAVVFMPVPTGEIVKVTRRWARDTRNVHILGPGQHRRGTPKFRKRDSLRISTDEDRWDGKNMDVLRQAADILTRNEQGRVVFARSN